MVDSMTPLGGHVFAGFVRAIGFTMMLAIGIAAAAPLALAQDKVSEEDAKKQLRKSKRELEAARAREKQISGELEKLARVRAALNKNLIEAAARVQASEARLSKIESRLAALSQQQEQVRGSIAARHATIAKLLAAMQRIGRQPPPALVTRRNDALKMVRSAMLMASVFPELKLQAEGLTSELDDLVRFGEGIKLQRDKLKTENDKLIKDRDRIGALIANKQALAQSQHAKLAKIREAAARHSSSVTYLGELVERMDKEIAVAGLAQYEAELAAMKKRDKELGVVELKPRDQAQVAMLSPGRLKPAMPFTERRGKLSRPASGREIRAFGSDNEFGEKAKGTLIAARADAQITSPVDGWVAYADEFRTYGQLLIINAGGGYHILLAGMRRIDVGVGQFVLAGEPVAVMGAAARGESGQTGRPGQTLYIEFRKDGRPIDPGPWWAKSPERVQG
ncbi:MAG: murein hydrolase activator EnvC family protein [Methyloligellaceae bacterium]